MVELHIHGKIRNALPINALHLFDDVDVSVDVDGEDSVGIDDLILRRRLIPPFPVSFFSCLCGCSSRGSGSSDAPSAPFLVSNS